MKIILAIKGATQKNLVFITDDQKVLDLAEAIKATRAGKIASVYVVDKKIGSYIRTKQSVPKNQELKNISISGRDLISYAQGAHAVSTPALTKYLELYLAGLKEGEPFIVPVGQPKVLTAVVKEMIVQNRQYIFAAAKAFDLDQNLIGAIIIDETARLAPFEEVIDFLLADIVGKNTSIGVAQVKTDTANDLIKKKLYNPNPHDSKLPFQRMNRSARMHLYSYLADPKHCIFFEAAYIRGMIDYWASSADLSKRPEIIGTLYAPGYKTPNTDPKTNPRGEQIGGEFYNLAKKWLNEAQN